MKKKNNLIWIDLEMTGLDVEKNSIIEIATIITDKNLNILSEGPEIAIFQKKSILDTMNHWNKKTHIKTNLINRVKKSKYSIYLAEKKTLHFIKKWTYFQSSPLCGNSIFHDRIFLKKYMPKLENYFHYRNIDVSTIKELIKRWLPKNINQFQKKYSHKAKKDIIESIFELQFYKKNFIRTKN